MSDLSDARIMRAIELCREQLRGAVDRNTTVVPPAADPVFHYAKALRQGGVMASSRVRAWVPAHLHGLLGR